VHLKLCEFVQTKYNTFLGMYLNSTKINDLQDLIKSAKHTRTMTKLQWKKKTRENCAPWSTLRAILK